MTTPDIGTIDHAKLLTRGSHPGVQTAMAWLAFSHLPEELRRYSEPLYRAGMELVLTIFNDSAELVTALNRLVEAKDWAVRAGIRSSTGEPGPVPRPQTVGDIPTFPTANDVAAERWGTPLRPIRDNPQA